MSKRRGYAGRRRRGYRPVRRRVSRRQRIPGTARKVGFRL